MIRYLFPLEDVRVHDFAIEDAGSERAPRHGRDEPQQQHQLELVVEGEPERKNFSFPRTVNLSKFEGKRERSTGIILGKGEEGEYIRCVLRSRSRFTCGDSHR